MPRNELRGALLTSGALACAALLAAPAYAKGKDQGVGGEDRAAGGTIRPFSGDVGPNAGNIRSFAGDVMGTAGNIRSFSGDATADAGNIRSFAGNIRSFAGNIRSFWDTTTTTTSYDPNFWGALRPQSGTLAANAGNIRSFAGSFEAYAGNIRSFAGNIRSFSGALLSYDQAPTTYQGMNSAIQDMVNQTKATWGSAIQAQTGKTFEDAFANKMLSKYGINLQDPSSLAGLDEVGVELFLLDWYDNVQLYSGQDQVDHWMKAVNWSPSLTQNMGSGLDTKIGILDFTITGGEAGNVVASSGISTVAPGHGSAVASLIVAKHDGRGVMGIAPNASVLSYNPFDATMTAGWTDIGNGVKYLVQNGASVLNMSLGVPGYTFAPGWYNVFKDPATWDAAKTHVFVLAAGNDGITQTQNVVFEGPKITNILVVGSVKPDGTISDFSNRPGTTCLTGPDGKCPPNGMLMNRFIVAPGEFMLVSDGQGGVTRMSGTSFAAPLVSGTIALIHDRWPWLADKPKDTTNIILGSARDLGAPGVDPVYGVGMLDVQAALSPLAWGANLKWKVSTRDGAVKDVPAGDILATKSSTISLWEANKVYFTIFEDTGDSFRDFSIPLSTKLVGQTVGTSGEQFNAYLQSRFWSWFNAGRTCEATNKCDKTVGAFQLASTYSGAGVIGGLRAMSFATPKDYRPGLRQGSVPFDTGMLLASQNGALQLRFGGGDGSTFVGQGGFGMRSDYDVRYGGANPFLGLGSGAGYASAGVRLNDRVTVSTGVSRQDAVLDFERMTPQERQVMGGMKAYRAGANTLSLAYRASDRLRANIGYTLLNERSGLLGVRSLDPNDLTRGTTTDAATMGADYAVTSGLTVSLTGTVGRTRSGGRDGQQITVADGGLVSSSWQFALAKDGVFDGRDKLRVTFAQPLHVEAGKIAVSGIEVVDRMTGELGEVQQNVALDGGRRRLVAEALYGRTIADGAAQLNLFGRADLRSNDQTQPALTAGGSFRLAF